MTTTPLYFSLAPYIYAAYFDTSVIILNGKADTYISLIGDAAQAFRFILSHEFFHHEHDTYNSIGVYSENDYSDWIVYFTQKKFITQNTYSTPLIGPLQEGGLIEYRWDHKTSWKPFAQASWWDIAQAYYLLIKVHRTMKRSGMFGIISLITDTAFKNNSHNPTEQELQKISAAVDAASLLYPQKALCLAWATTFVLLALRRGWKVNLVVGVQTNPFYAHAWAQTLSGAVINDDPRIAHVLPIIFKEPYN